MEEPLSLTSPTFQFWLKSILIVDIMEQCFSFHFIEGQSSLSLSEETGLLKNAEQFCKYYKCIHISITQFNIAHKASDDFFRSSIRFFMQSTNICGKPMKCQMTLENRVESRNGRKLNFEIRQSLVEFLPLPLIR